MLEGDWGRSHNYADALHLVEDKLAPYRDHWNRHWTAFNQAVAEAKRLPKGFGDLVRSSWRPYIPGEPAGKADLTRTTARQAFAKLPHYLKWNPDDDGSLPIWEKFFIVPLPPGEEMVSPRTE